MTSDPPHPSPLRRLPLPCSEPPFDDELGPAPAGGPPRRPTAPGFQGTLALAFVLPSGLPAVPEPPPDLHLIEDDGDSPDEFGPRPTGRAALPSPRTWAARVVQAIVEVLSGVRPATQLVRWTTEEVYEEISSRVLPGRGWGRRGPAARRRPLAARERARRRRRRGLRAGASRRALDRGRPATGGHGRPLAVHRPRAGLTARRRCAQGYALSRVRRGGCVGSPWQRLYFLPEPHGHGALRGTSPIVVVGCRLTDGLRRRAARVAVDASARSTAAAPDGSGPRGPWRPPRGGASPSARRRRSRSRPRPGPRG